MKTVNLTYITDNSIKIINELTDIDINREANKIILRKKDEVSIEIENKQGYIQLSQGIDKFYDIEKLYKNIVEKVIARRELNIEIEDKNNNLRVSFS